MDFITEALKKAFETGRNTSSIIVDDEVIVLHDEMNIEELFELFYSEVTLSKEHFSYIENSFLNVCEQSKGNEFYYGRARNEECFSSLLEEFQYEFNLFTKNHNFF